MLFAKDIKKGNLHFPFFDFNNQLLRWNDKEKTAEILIDDAFKIEYTPEFIIAAHKEEGNLFVSRLCRKTLECEKIFDISALYSNFKYQKIFSELILADMEYKDNKLMLILKDFYRYFVTLTDLNNMETKIVTEWEF